MITTEIKYFIENIALAVVATTDTGGHPHLALGNNIKALDTEHLAFENWFCHTTLRNVEQNHRVAVAVMEPGSGTGYQFAGMVVRGYDAAILDGYAPEAEAPGEPQILTRFVVRVEEVMSFCSGIHTDLPIG